MRQQNTSILKYLTAIFLFLFAAVINGQEVQSRTLSESIKVDAILYHENGTIYGSGGWNGPELYEIKPNGDVSLHASGLIGVVDMVWGEKDTIIGSSYQDGWLLKISPNGKTKEFVKLSYGLASLYRDFNGDIICTINPGLAHPSAGSVKRVKPDGSVSNFASGGSINKPSGVTQDDEGNYYISNLGDGRITKVNTDGTKELFATVPATGTWKIGYIKYWKGALYTSAISENKIYKTTLDGKVSVYAGTGSYGNSNGALLSATFKEPNGMAIAGDTLFIISGINQTNKLRYIVDVTTDLGEKPGTVPYGHKLEANYPNPFNPSTTINYELSNQAFVKLNVYNSLGELVDTIVSESQQAGSYQVNWNGTDSYGNSLSSGFYIYELTADNFRESRKMMLMK